MSSVGPRKAPKTLSRSLYRGMRLTVTEGPNGDWCLITVSVKQLHGKWDEWTMLFPALRLEHEPITSPKDALYLLSEALRMARREV